MKKGYEIKRKDGVKYFMWDGDHPCSDRKIERERFDNVIFDSVSFKKTVFRDCVCFDCVFKNCKFEKARFWGGRWSGVRVDRCDFSNSNFFDMIICCCPLRGSDLRGVAMADVVVVKGEIKKCNMTGASVSRVMFSGTSFSDVDLEDAIFDGVCMSEVVGMDYASVSFPGHGEIGRLLLAVRHGSGVLYHCGCFHGTEEELREYIDNHNVFYVKSRMLALETVKGLLEKGGK
jgi:hypothetical protein